MSLPASPPTPLIDWATLITLATQAQANAYAKYSGYAVGAALVTDTGRLFSGCNVENASFGLTLCAERSAVAAMIAAGERTIAAIAVVTPGSERGTPCGMCRQTIVEFGRDSLIGLAAAGASAPERTMTIGELFPDAFRGDLVRS